VFVLVRTSNPGARDLQGLRSDGRRVFERLAEALAPLVERCVAPRTGWSSLGVVVGATWPEESRRVRALLPRALFLVPGYGAQGASAHEALAGFVAGAGGRLEGGVVSSSRALLFPPGAEAADAAGWERALDEAIARSAGELAAAAQEGPSSRAPG
jgi:orotidine-5'-phosphate decarboxylase